VTVTNQGLNQGLNQPPTRPAGALRPRVRHGFLAAALALVAALRMVDGDTLWAGLLGAGAVAETALLVAARRRPAAPARQASQEPSGVPGASAAPVAPAAPADRLPPRTQVETSLAGHRRNLRIWQAGLAACTVGSVAVLTSAPSLAIVLGVVALLSLRQVRRERRSLVVLRHLAGNGRALDERSV
jgi:hypothetical protein